MNKDTVTGIVGALVLVAAMTGVFFYERGQFEEYTVTWPDVPGNAATASGDLAHGETGSPHRFNVSLQDALVAHVMVEITWDENIKDTFKVEVTAPNGTTHEEDGTGGTIRLDIPVQDAPRDAAFADRNQGGALEQASASIDRDARSAGQGDWTVRVSLVEALRPHETLGDVETLTEEGENSYDLQFTPHTWEPTADPTD